MPDELRTAVIDAYSELSRRLGSHDPAVAVRSSATAEDLAGTSFAGMHRTLTNVRGPQALLDAVSSCWQSVYGTRALSYRIAQHIEGKPAIAVVVQAMVPAASAGVAFSADPATGSSDVIVVEGAPGQGEVVVGGLVEPDTYTLSRSPLEIRDVRIGVKTQKIIAGAGGDQTVTLSADEGSARVLTDTQVLAIAHLVLDAEDHFGCPQDLEWCYDDRWRRTRRADPPDHDAARVGRDGRRRRPCGRRARHSRDRSRRKPRGSCRARSAFSPPPLKARSSSLARCSWPR